MNLPLVVPFCWLQLTGPAWSMYILYKCMHKRKQKSIEKKDESAQNLCSDEYERWIYDGGTRVKKKKGILLLQSSIRQSGATSVFYIFLGFPNIVVFLLLFIFNFLNSPPEKKRRRSGKLNNRLKLFRYGLGDIYTFTNFNPISPFCSLMPSSFFVSFDYYARRRQNTKGTEPIDFQSNRKI